MRRIKTKIWKTKLWLKKKLWRLTIKYLKPRIYLGQDRSGYVIFLAGKDYSIDKNYYRFPKFEDERARNSDTVYLVN